jgi:dipeptidyl aminopeptidase/acylaminoacyl peptidase
MPHPLSPEALVYGLVQVSDPQVSPDGARVVYGRTLTDRESRQATSHLWLCDIDGGNARQLTYAGKQHGWARWSPDGTQLAFVSDRVTKSAIFVLPLAGHGEARELTRHNGPISNLAWSPDGASLAYNTPFDPANPEECEPEAGAVPPVRVIRRRDYKLDGRGFLGEVRQQVFVVALATGERRRLTRESLDHLGPLWSPDGCSIVVRRGVPGQVLRTQIALVDVATGDVRTIGPAMSGTTCAWSPTGDRLLISGSAEAGGQPDFYLHTLAHSDLRRLTDDLSFLPAPLSRNGAPAPLVWAEEDEVLAHGIRAGGSGLYHLQLSSGQTEPLVIWQALHSGLSVSADGRVAVQEGGDLASWSEVVVTDLGSGESRTITALNQETLADAPPARWEEFEVRRGDDTIPAWLFFPPNFDPARRYPVILDVHGGPHGHYGYHLNATQQCLATNGFLVVAANPRGSSSYGRHFAAAVVGDNGGEDYLDLMAVLDAVLERPYADRTRTGIWGYSYGGYMTAWTLGQTDRFRAAICGAPRFDNPSAYGSCDDGPNLSGYQMGGTPWEQRERFVARSPSARAHLIRTPTLLIHGEADDRCPLNQSEQFFNTLLEVGCEAEFVRYPNCAHGFVSSGPPAYRVDLLTRQLAWFRRYLGEAQ